ncbi:MAG: hypothetical protein JSV81_20805 [Anaerolineales bacterium]|nr:MAG: hypothetical protein JSV81_20805 [Anaerolineales bacterium]
MSPTTSSFPNNSSQTLLNMPSWSLPILLFTILLSTYMFTYTGMLTSADEVSIAAVTENLAARGKFNTDQLIWSAWEHGWMAQGTLGLDGHMYSKKGVGISILLAPLIKLSLAIRSVGHTHLLMLFGPLICALTGLLVMAIACQWRYPPTAGFTLGLVCGLGTIVWPYSKTLFQEPLIGLALVVTVYAISSKLNTRTMLLASLMLALAMMNRLPNALAIPPVVLYGLYRLHKSIEHQNWRTRLWLIGILLSMPLVAGITLAHYNWLRFGAWTSTGYIAGETFSTPLFQGLSGLLFSPEESLFLFSPVLVFAIVGMPLLFQRFKAEAVLVFTLIAINLCLFALWYDWRGGLAWGPRFTVPLTPLLVISMLPLFHEWVFLRGGWRRWIFVSVALISVAVQVVGSSVFYFETNKPWPVLAAFAQFDLTNLDTAWMQAGPVVEWQVIGLLLGIIAIAFYLAFLILHHRQRSALVTLSSIGLLLITLAVASWGLTRIFADQRLAGGDDYRALAARLTEATSPRDAIIVDNHIYTEFFLNYSQSSAPRYGFLRSDALRPEAKTLLEGLALSADNIWLVSDRPTNAALPKPEETWLNEHTFRVGEEAFSDYARLIRYYHPPPGSLNKHLPAVTFENGARLVEYQLAESENWSPGEVVSLALAWQVPPTSTEIATSVQLLRPEGILIWQSDANLSASSAIDLVVNRYGILLPNDSPPGEYQIWVVLYHPATGERVQVINRGHLTGQDALVLTKLNLK